MGWKNHVGRYGAVLKLHRQLPGENVRPAFCHTAAVFFFLSRPRAAALTLSPGSTATAAA